MQLIYHNCTAPRPLREYPYVRVDKRFYSLGFRLLDPPGDGGATVDVIGPPPGELFSETNDNSLWRSC
jgi:hypothetical protein